MIDGLMAAMQIKIESQDRQLVEALAREAKLRGLLAELYAIVKGECPSLFNGDSGGDAVLELDICDALGVKP